jgi:hypothetical protein
MIDWFMNGTSKKVKKGSSKAVNNDFLNMFLGQGHPNPRDRITKQQGMFLKKTKVGSGMSHMRFWDSDGDGVINGLDCMPRNRKRHMRMSEIAMKKERPPYFYLYHGTSKKAADNISGKGLTPAKVGGHDLTFSEEMRNDKGEEVYLTSKPSYAGFYASQKALKDNSKPVILKVKTPSKDIKKETFDFEHSYVGQDEFTVDKIDKENISLFAEGEDKIDGVFTKYQAKDWGRDNFLIIDRDEQREYEAQEAFQETFNDDEEGPKDD